MRAYTEALVPALAAETLDPVRAVATPEQVDRVRLYVIELTNEDSIRVDARLVSLEVKEATAQDDVAKVVTSEEWTFVSKSIESGEEVSREDFAGEVTYTLVKEPGGSAWLVSDVDSRLSQ